MNKIQNCHLPDGVPCKHPGCLSHISHPCEGCGRVGGRYLRTFPELEKKFTLGIVKRCVEYAKGFDRVEKSGIKYFLGYESGFRNITDFLNSGLFPLLLHRAVEGWNKKSDGHLRFIIQDKDCLSVFVNESDRKLFKYNNYQPCHLTACEMAIMDCLCEVLK